MRSLSIICVVIAFLAMFFFMSKAEIVNHEIFAVAIGCFWLICARLAQAAAHHNTSPFVKPKPVLPSAEKVESV